MSTVRATGEAVSRHPEADAVDSGHHVLGQISRDQHPQHKTSLGFQETPSRPPAFERTNADVLRMINPVRAGARESVINGSSNVANPVVPVAAVDESCITRTTQEIEPVNIRDGNFAAARERARTSLDFGLTEDEGQQFLRIISESLLIKRHYELFLWLTSLRQFIPHDIFVSVWGDFSKGDLKIDVISSLPGVRTSSISGCQLHEIVESAHQAWAEGGRQARAARMSEAVRINGCDCAVHVALRGMKSVLVHGLADERGGYESLYLAFTSGPQTLGRCKDKFLSLANAIVPQIDVAFRKVAAFPLSPGKDAPSRWLDLSARERQILDWICVGKKNVDIAAELGISHFTVKNHVQRIFKKIGASNRTQAAAKYNQSRRHVVVQPHAE